MNHLSPQNHQAGAKRPRLHVRDEKSSGTAGTTYSAGAYQQHTLNTVVHNSVAGASLASNQVTLPAGDWQVNASVIVVNAVQRIAIYSVTDSSYLVLGLNNGTAGAVGGPGAYLVGTFTLAGPAVIELHWRGSNTGAALALSFGDAEIYADVVFEKLS